MLWLSLKSPMPSILFPTVTSDILSRTSKKYSRLSSEISSPNPVLHPVANPFKNIVLPKGMLTIF